MNLRSIVYGLLPIASLLPSPAGCDRSALAQSQGTRISEFPARFAERAYYSQMVFSPDGKTLVQVNHEGVVKLRDMRTGRAEVLPDPYKGKQWVDAVAYSKDGQLLAVARASRDLVLWDVAAKKVRSRLPLDGTGVHRMVFMEGDQTLSMLLGTQKGKYLAERWNVASGARRGTVDLGSIIPEVMAPDGRYAILRAYLQANWDGYAVFDLAKGARCFDLKPGGWVFSRDGSILISCEENGLWLRQVPSGKVLKHFDPSPPFSLGYTPRPSVSDDGKLLAVALHPHPNLVSLISLESGKLLDQLEGGPPLTICDLGLLSPDGRILATRTEGVNQKDQGVDPLLKLWTLPASW